MEFLNESQRRMVLAKVLDTVDKKFADLSRNTVDTAKLRTEHESEIIRSQRAEEFEQAMNAMLNQLGASHTGFFHQNKLRAVSRIAIAATFAKAETPDGTRWIFQDVHAGGVAARAGIKPGDVLLTLSDRELVPPDPATFALGGACTVTVRRPDGSTVRHTLEVPGSQKKNRPIVIPDQVVTALKLGRDVGVIRVSMFPGILGMDVARDISRAVADLDCTRLIFDLRGNTGGGIGCLRLMSHLCPDKRGVGYSIGRSHIRNGYDKEDLRRFDRVPASMLGVIPLIFRFALAGRSAAVFSEGLGVRRHHGRVVLLVNEHSASATEMAAAFASEYRLATLVGTRTAGKVVGASSFMVGFGYRVILPVAAYFTWQDTNLEGRGVQPDVVEPLLPQALWSGQDNQAERALSAASML